MLSSGFRRLRSLIGWAGLSGGALVCLLGLAAFVAPGFWAADNMSFFLRQFLAAGVAGLAGGLLGLTVIHRRPRLYKTLLFSHLGLLLLLASLTVWKTVEFTRPQVSPTSADSTFRIVAINLERLFLEDPTLTDFLHNSEADILVFEETAWWLQRRYWQRLGLAVGAAGKPPFPEHMYIGPLGDIAVYSRYPILEHRTVLVESAEGQPRQDMHEIPVLTLDVDGRRVNLVALHPASPRTEVRWKNRQAYLSQLDGIIDELQSQPASETIIIGDWNLSPWSVYFGQLLERFDLHTAFPDSLPQTTRFFFDYRLHWILGAIVDHVALSSGLRFADVQLGPDIGSDHLPLIADVVIPAQGGR